MVSPLKASSGQFPFHCSLGVSTRKARLAGVPSPAASIVARKGRALRQNLWFEYGFLTDTSEEYDIAKMVIVSKATGTAIAPIRERLQDVYDALVILALEIFSHLRYNQKKRQRSARYARGYL